MDHNPQFSHAFLSAEGPTRFFRSSMYRDPQYFLPLWFFNNSSVIIHISNMLFSFYCFTLFRCLPKIMGSNCHTSFFFLSPFYIESNWCCDGTLCLFWPAWYHILLHPLLLLPLASCCKYSWHCNFIFCELSFLLGVSRIRFSIRCDFISQYGRWYRRNPYIWTRVLWARIIWFSGLQLNNVVGSTKVL